MQVERVIGRYDGETAGPLVIFIAGIHGNETAGVEALQQVFEILEAKKPSIHGSIVGLAGNIEALEKEVRYIDTDLNRVWLDEDSDSQVHEYKERDELSESLTNMLSAQEGKVFFFDLHSTSSESSPYIMMSDTLRNRELGRVVGLPIMLGLLEHLSGMLIDVTSRSGFPTLLFQGGGNKNPDTLIHHIGFIWKVLKAKCELEVSAVPEFKTPMSRLNGFAPLNADHEFTEIAYTHKLLKDEHFEMNPGYMNFQPVAKNEVVASSDRGKVKVPFMGRIFMPRYQKLGTEGFYMVKRIKAFWIRFSRRFRLFKHHDKLHWMLGVYKISDDPLTFKIDQQLTFLWALEVFHLLGYIKVRQDGPILFMTRREDEIQPPTTKEAIDQFSSKKYLRSELKNIKSQFKVVLPKEYKL